MVVHQIVVLHNGQSHSLDYDSDDGLEVLKMQLFSLTLVPPEKQKIVDNSDKILTDESDFSKLAAAFECTITLLEEEKENIVSPCASPQDRAAMEKADEELARLLQAEEVAMVSRQQFAEHGRKEFASVIENQIDKVLQYEDPLHQEAARRTVQLHELKEKAAIALAQEGKRNPGRSEIEHALLLQLLLWFKKSFRWVNVAPCTLCTAETDAVGMAKPNFEELKCGANRVELYRCRKCQTVTRFPRYNDTLKLLETRRGRCGEWANCFTLYCRTFGYRARLVLDFADHVWTECFSEFLGRWVHMDPCEGVLDKPLLYEQGWRKKQNYVIALSKDGVYDVTKRYTKNWEEVRLRRNITSEENVTEVIATLTAHLRSTFGSDYLRQLKALDEKEADELSTSLQRHSRSSELLRGRQTGTEEWRMARGELGTTVSVASGKKSCPKRLCVDHHVSKILQALGSFKKLDGKELIPVLDNILKNLCGLLYKLKEAPFEKRHLQASLQSEYSLLVQAIDDDVLEELLQALGLVRRKDHQGEICICSDDPIETALALPVALEKLENLMTAAKDSRGSDCVHDQITFLAENERLCGGWTQASGEEAPTGIAIAAFDGLQSTKWEEPTGSRGAWLVYYLPDGATAHVDVYELTSANDCPKRDPMNWVLEGSQDRGCTWIILDAQHSQLFSRRFERRSYRVVQESTKAFNALRFRFLSIQDLSNESRLQLSCIDFYQRKDKMQAP